MNELIKSVMFYVFLFGCGAAIVYLFSVVVFETPFEVFQSPEGDEGSGERLMAERFNLKGGEYEGWIVEFNEEPAVESVEEETQANAGITGNAVSSTRLQRIRNEKQQAKPKISEIIKKKRGGSVVGKSKSKKGVYLSPEEDLAEDLVLGEYEKVFNGIALNITDEEAEEIKNLPEVKNVYPNLRVEATLMDSVPLIGADKVWQMDKDGGTCGESGKECLTGKGVTIGIIDTGVDYTHEDLGRCFGENCKVIGGYDFINYDDDPMDDNGHGTHVAATAAGNGQLKGVAPDAKIYAYKVLDGEGSGYWDDVLAAIEGSVDPNQDGDTSDKLNVISLSLGGDCDGLYDAYCGPGDPVSTAIDNVVGAGVVAVVAAGNSGPGEATIGIPATARKAITVGAVDKNKDLAYFSSRGPVIADDKSFALIKPDVVAPGVNICAAQSSQDNIWQWINEWDGSDVHCLDNKHIAISGTSMATPHVSGVVALLKQKHPDWTAEEIKMTLRNTAVLLNPDLEYSINDQGYGKVDALLAISSERFPLAQLETNGLVDGTLDIKGTAAGEGFTKYTIFIGEGLNPSEWKVIVESTQSVTNGILFSSYQTFKLEDGVYTLRLVVSNNRSKESKDQSILILDNYRLDISSPLNGDVYRAKTLLDINGHVKAPNLSLKLSYKTAGSNQEEMTNGITLSLSEGMSEAQGVFASWDTSSLVDGKYTLAIRLFSRVFNDTLEVETKFINVSFDSTLREGWPQRIPAYYDPDYWSESSQKRLQSLSLKEKKLVSVRISASPKMAMRKIFDPAFREISSAIVQKDATILRKMRQQEGADQENGVYYSMYPFDPVVEDIDGDGKKEIVVTVTGNPHKTYAFRSDGSQLPGWPVSLPTTQTNPYSTNPAIADINNDGKKEVFIYGGPDIFVYDSNGRLLRTIRVFNYQEDFESLLEEITLTDLTGDGIPEIILSLADYLSADESSPFVEKVVVMDVNGNLLPGWPKPVFDYDATNEQTDYNWYCNSFTKFVPADIDGDGKKEIAVAATRIVPNEPPFDDWLNEEGYWHCQTKVLVFSLSGRLLSGFPVDIPGEYQTQPVAGDIDGDGFDEIVVGTQLSLEDKWVRNDLTRSGLYVIGYNGKIKDGWPKLVGNDINSVVLTKTIPDKNLEIAAMVQTIRLLDHLGNQIFDKPIEEGLLGYFNFVSGGEGYPFSLFGGLRFDPIDAILEYGIFSLSNNIREGSKLFKATEWGYWNSPVLVDIDGDGDGELIMTTEDTYIDGDYKHRGSVYVWDIPGEFDEKSLSWPQFMHDAQHTNYYPTPRLCVDSDDRNIFTKGNVTLRNGDVYIDECSASKKQVFEKLCVREEKGNIVLSNTVFNCPVVDCADGACDNRIYDSGFEQKLTTPISTGRVNAKPAEGKWGITKGVAVAKPKGESDNVLVTEVNAKNKKNIPADGAAGVQIIPVEPGKKYKISVSAKVGVKKANEIVYITPLDQNKNMLSMSSERTISGFKVGKWETKSIDLDASVGTAYLKISLVKSRNTDGIVYWDDINVVEVK